MAAVESEAVSVAAQEPIEVGGGSHGGLRCYDCGPPVESFPLFALTGIVIGLVVIGVIMLRRSLRRRR